MSGCHHYLGIGHSKRARVRVGPPSDGFRPEAAPGSFRRTVMAVRERVTQGVGSGGR
jgi:hypothetical protein